MMQLLCNGVFLDLPANVSVTYTRSNPLFSFGDMKLERTTSFDIPSTPKNEKAFSMGNLLANEGTIMRGKYAAQLIDGVVSRDGFIYITSYTSGVYKSVFVYGEMIQLKEIKDAGVIGNYISPTDSAIWNGVKSASVGNFTTLGYFSKLDFTTAPYKFEEQIFPSIKFSYLLNLCAAHFGVTIQNLPSAVSTWYITMDKMLATQDSDAIFGNRVYLSNNLPQVNFIDLLKCAAVLNGKMFDVVGNTVTFTDCNDFGSWAEKNIDGSVVAVGSMTRSFADYGQKNIVAWKNQEAVNRIRSQYQDPSGEYDTDNNNLTEEVNVYEPPFAYAMDTIVEDQPTPTPTYEAQQYESGVYISRKDGANLRALYADGFMPKNALLERLFSESTTVEVQVRMSRFEYESVTNKTTFHYDGVRFVWYDAKYSNGIATFKLCKI